MRPLPQPQLSIPIRAVHRDCRSCAVSELAKREGICCLCPMLVTDNRGRLWLFNLWPLNGEVVYALPKHLERVPDALIADQA